ncbi:MAG: hypothetical protein ACHQQS_10120 [Thermoanaerobaculales bacterium]
MTSRILPLAICAIALVTAPLLAQESAPPATNPAATETSTEQSAPVQVTGTVASLGDDHLDLSVEHVVAASPEVTSALEGKTITFKLDAKTEKPADLKAADRVDLWFMEAEGAHLATRIAPALSHNESVGSAIGLSAAGEPPSPAAGQSASPPPPPANEPGTASPAPQGAVSTKETVSQPNPAASQTVETSPAPKRAASTKKAVGKRDLATSVESETVAPPDTAKVVASTSDNVVGEANPGASVPATPLGTSAEPDAGTEEGPGSPEAISSTQLKVKPDNGDQWQLLVGIGLVALSALVVLRLTLGRKQAVVSLDLGRSPQWR